MRRRLTVTDPAVQDEGDRKFAAEMSAFLRLAEAAPGRAVLVTADRRIASVGFFGGSDRDHLRESFDDMARDLARFLVRLSKGQAPGKE